ncbi:MAG: hydrogenase maturation nickel metallochaperone HypA [Desulfohalobiaceae bacterium]|nr:hydrogenase maturation nickel metallochaperone HypA [Desulfohalobiaceae bacterium]
MHEMSVAQSLIHIIQSEMDKNAVTSLQTVKVKAGRINAIVPEALETAFHTLTQGTTMQGARLELETVPLELECGSCGTRFISATEDPLFLHSECPQCGWELGHRVVKGRELFIEYIEAD